MSRVRPVSVHPDLSGVQQITQSLADGFNTDEQTWARLEPLRRLRRLLHPHMKRAKRQKQDLADFARAQPPKDCVAQWMIDA